MILGQPFLRQLLVTPVYLLIFGSLGCHWYSSNIQDQPILKVDSNVLTTKEFADELAHQLSKYDALTSKDPKIVAQIKKSIVDQFIVDSILKTWAEKNKVPLNKNDIDLELKRVRASFPDDFAFREELTKQGLSVGQWQKKVETQLLERAIFDEIEKSTPIPTEKEISDEYEKNKAQYKLNERIYLQQIVLSNNSDANEVLRNLKEKQSFDKMAKQFSIAPEGKKGGVVGWVERGTLDVFDQAFNLPLGKLSEVMQSPYGFHIMVVLKREGPSTRPLTSIKETIKRNIQSQKSQKQFSKWLEEQIRSVHVFKDQRTIDKMFVETRKD